MFDKRGVIRTDIIEQDIGTSTPPRDSGALSGILAGVKFHRRRGRSDDPRRLPIPASRLGTRRDPTVLHPELPRGPAQRGRPVRLSGLAHPVHSVGWEAGRMVGLGIADAAGGCDSRGRACRRVPGNLGAVRRGAPRPLAFAALASAVAGLLSPLYFVWEPAGWFMPAGRFSGLLISGIAGARLSRRSG
jgi:hypothetical protein